MSDLSPIAILRKYEVQAKKRLGQHFLIDPNTIRRIIAAVDPHADDRVMEIGPGIGILTRMLVEQCPHLTAVETDAEMITLLRDELGDRLTLLHQDILTVDLPALFAGPHRWKIVGNLPYNISTPILFALRDQHPHLTSATVMLQREVAERIMAKPGMKPYGILAISMQIVADVTRVMHVGPQSFSPPPRVDSTVIQLKFLEKPRFGVKNLEKFQKMVDAAFNQRRKTIKNSLMSRYWKGTAAELEAALENAGINPGDRAETVSIERLARLHQTI